MLKGKSKAFKPKGPVRRPGVGQSSTAPSKAPTRESTTEPISTDTANPSKRKDRHDDTVIPPPAKRVATPPPSDTVLTTNHHPSPSRSSNRKTSQQPPPTPPPTQSEIPSNPSASTQIGPEPLAVQATDQRQTGSVLAGKKDSSQNATSSSVSTPASTEVTQPQTASVNISIDGGPSTLSPKRSRNAPRKPLVNKRAENLATVTNDAHVGSGRVEEMVSTAKVVSVVSNPESSTGERETPRRGSLSDTTSNRDESRPDLEDGNRSATLGPLGDRVGEPVISAAVDSTTSIEHTTPSLGAAGDVGNGIQATTNHGGSQLVPMATLNPDGTSGGIIEAPTAKTKKKRVVKRKKKKPADGQTDEGDEAVIDDDTEEPRVRKGKGSRSKKSKEPKQRKERRERSTTPSDAEEQTVDTTALTMSDLCKDLKIGKKFSRHEDIKQREDDRKAAIKARRDGQSDPEIAALLDGLQSNGDPTTAQASTGENIVAPNLPAGEEEEEPEPIRPAGQSVMMRIVDGQIVVDERSIQIDRHRLGQEDAGPMDIIEENDFTRIITSATYMKRETPKRWDWAAMDKFYNGLRSFGTDFGLIANMFPGRTRRQVKLLFNREERVNPELIKRTLAGEPVPIDLEAYTEMSGKTYVELSEIAAESQALDDQHKADLAAIERRKNAANKRKKDAIHGRNSAKDILDALSDDDDEHHTGGGGGGGDGGGSSAKENRAPSSRSREASTSAYASSAGKRGKKGSKQSKANKHSMRAGGDIVEVVGDI